MIDPTKQHFSLLQTTDGCVRVVRQLSDLEYVVLGPYCRPIYHCRRRDHNDIIMI